MSILILKAKILTFANKKENIIIINTNIYYATCKLKKSQVFAKFIRDLEYQVDKKAR